MHDAPTDARLLVEVATISLRRDRLVKAPLHARAGVDACWIVGVASRAVLVRRSPSGAGFVDVSWHGEGGLVRPLDCPDVEIGVRSVLPGPQ